MHDRQLPAQAEEALESLARRGDERGLRAAVEELVKGGLGAREAARLLAEPAVAETLEDWAIESLVRVALTRGLFEREWRSAAEESDLWRVDEEDMKEAQNALIDVLRRVCRGLAERGNDRGLQAMLGPLAAAAAAQTRRKSDLRHMSERAFSEVPVATALFEDRWPEKSVLWEPGVAEALGDIGDEFGVEETPRRGVVEAAEGT